jgi:glycosyltransferase involved in cell wall biosynthesis
LATPGDPVHKRYTKRHQVRLLAHADTVIVQTEIEARAVQGWGISRSRILKLGMALEHSEVTGGDGPRFRERYRIPPESQVIGHLATLDPNKGSTDLVRAVARLNASRLRPPAELVLAGPSSPVFERFLADLPGGTPSWLTLTGLLPSDQRAGFFAALDVFAMPSRTDSFGIVFLEAWANGLPVVAADAGGVPEVVRHDETGLLVPYGEDEQLAAALRRLLDDPELSRLFGTTGRNLVERGYTWDDRFATLLTRTREAIAQPRRGALGWFGRRAG